MVGIVSTSAIPRMNYAASENLKARVAAVLTV
jgi:hypothetical protein